MKLDDESETKGIVSFIWFVLAWALLLVFVVVKHFGYI